MVNITSWLAHLQHVNTHKEYFSWLDEPTLAELQADTRQEHIPWSEVLRYMDSLGPASGQGFPKTRRDRLVFPRDAQVHPYAQQERLIITGPFHETWLWFELTRWRYTPRGTDDYFYCLTTVYHNQSQVAWYGPHDAAWTQNLTFRVPGWTCHDHTLTAPDGQRLALEQLKPTVLMQSNGCLTCLDGTGLKQYALPSVSGLVVVHQFGSCDQLFVQPSSVYRRSWYRLQQQRRFQRPLGLHIAVDQAHDTRIFIPEIQQGQLITHQNENVQQRTQPPWSAGTSQPPTVHKLNHGRVLHVQHDKDGAWHVSITARRAPDVTPPALRISAWSVSTALWLIPLLILLTLLAFLSYIGVTRFIARHRSWVHTIPW